MQGHDTKKIKNTSRSTPHVQRDRLKFEHKGPAPDSVEAELKMQAMLAKKLKLKKVRCSLMPSLHDVPQQHASSCEGGSKCRSDLTALQGQSRTGPDDGLDGLLEGFEDLNGAVPVATAEVPQSVGEEVDRDSDDPGFVTTSGLETDVIDSDENDIDSGRDSFMTEETGEQDGSLCTSDELNDDDPVGVSLLQSFVVAANSSAILQCCHRLVLTAKISLVGLQIPVARDFHHSR